MAANRAVNSCSFVPIRGYKGLKIFENFVPQFPKKEVKGCFRRLNNNIICANPRHPCNRATGISEIEGKAARVAASESGKSEFQFVVLCSLSQLVSIFARGRIRPTADVVKEDLY